MNLTTADLEVAYYVFSRFINGRLAAGKPVPAAVRPLFNRIELMSVTGHVYGTDPQRSDEELIGTAEAAELLDCDPRHVRRLVNDLEGHRVNGRWVFTRSVVEQYEEQRSAHRRSCQGTG